MNDLVNEIKNELYNDRIKASLGKILPYIAGIFIIVVCVISLSFWYKNYKMNIIYYDGGQYLLAINKVKAENLEEGLRRFEVISNGSSNYSALAKLNLTSYAIYSKNYSKASQLLKKINNNNSFNPTIRNLAHLYEIEIDYESNKISIEETIDKIKLYIEKDNEFRFSAQEFLAALYLKNGNTNASLEVLNYLMTNPKVPPTILKRSQQYRALIK